MLINERGVREHIAAATAALNQPGGGKGAVMAEQGGLGNRLQPARVASAAPEP